MKKYAAILTLVVLGCGEGTSRSPSSGEGAAAPPGSPVAAGASGSGATAAELNFSVLSGAYRRTALALEFWPCGASTTYVVVAGPEARIAFREALRWRSPWPDQTFFVVLEGAAIADAGNDARGAEAPPGRRMYVARVDSLRLWRATDCQGRRPPWR
jgi:hypothetical protein